jgi:hypothetical protein
VRFNFVFQIFFLEILSKICSGQPVEVSEWN